MAMTAESLRAPLLFEIDIKNGLKQNPIWPQLMKDDKKANTIIVRVKDGTKDVDLTGATVTGSFISPLNSAEIPLTGSVNGNEASVTLIDECYAEDGYFEANVKLTIGETSRTILSITGNVLRKGSGAYIDVGNVIPSLDDIVAQYATMQQVTKDTQAAGTAANTAAGNATTAAGNANTAASKATTQATAAQQAAEAANAAAKNWGDSTAANSEKLGGSTLAQVIALAGDKAVTSLTGAVLSAMEQADRIALYTGGTRLLKVTNDATTVLLMLNSDGTTQWAGGERPKNLLDDSDFTNPVNQRGKTTYTGRSYSIDRWIASAGTTVTVQAGYIKLTNTTASGRSSIEQILPNNYTGKTMTVAICDHDTGKIYCNSGVVPETGNEIQRFATADFNGHTIRLALSIAGVLSVEIMIKNGAELNIKWVALYEGTYIAETLPPYVPKGYAAELAECRRYYKEFACKSDSFEITFFGYVTSDSKYIVIDVPFNMRSGGLPSVMLDGSITIRGISGYLESSSSGYSDVNVSVYGNTECEKGSICFRKKDGTVFADATNNTPVTVNMRPGSKITLSRDL